MAKPITVSIVGNAGPLKKTLSETEKALSSFGDGLKKFGLAAAAGLGAVGAGIGFAAKAAAEDQRSFKLLETTLRNVTKATDDQVKSVENQIAKMSMATGVADDKLRPAFDALVRGTKDITEAQKNMNLVLDISTALQMDATTVAEALARGFEGNTKSLRTLSPEMAQLIKDGASMDEILKTLNGNFSGAAAAAADTFQGRIARLQVAFSEIVEQVGYALLPMLESLAKFVAERIVPAVQRLADAFSQGGLSGVLKMVTGDLFKFYEEASSATKMIINATVAAGSFYVALKALTFIETVTTLINGMTAALNASTLSMGRFAVAGRTMAGVLGAAFLSVSVSLEGLAKDNYYMVRYILGGLAELANGAIRAIELVANDTNFIINGIISAINLIPGISIPLLSTDVKLPRFKTDFTSTAPSLPKTDIGFNRDDIPQLTIPSPVVPIPEPVNTPPAGGGGGGGGGGGSTRPGSGLIDNLQPDIGEQLGNIGGGGGGGGFGAAPGNEALLDGLTGGVNITINTVTADSNLPNLIVDALQKYNLYSGPIEVQIAA